MCVHCDLSLERDQSTTDFETDGVCRGLLFTPPSTSARVQSRVEFADLVVVCALTTLGVTWDYKRVPGWYQVAGTIYESTAAYMYQYMVSTRTRGSPVA